MNILHTQSFLLNAHARVAKWIDSSVLQWLSLPVVSVDMQNHIASKTFRSGESKNKSFGFRKSCRCPITQESLLPYVQKLCPVETCTYSALRLIFLTQRIESKYLSNISIQTTMSESFLHLTQQHPQRRGILDSGEVTCFIYYVQILTHGRYAYWRLDRTWRIYCWIMIH